MLFDVEVCDVKGRKNKLKEAIGKKKVLSISDNLASKLIKWGM
ncbi:MAG: hypothetical protein ACI9J3_001834 [Parvicellaceae bacterium]|jgi:hypothetical protein